MKTNKPAKTGTPRRPSGGLKLNRADRAFIQATISRAALSSRLGTQFNGERDLYKTFGYPQNPGYDEYKNLFDRQGLANRLVSILPNDVWSTDPILIDGDSRSDNLDDSASPFVKGWAELLERLPVTTAFRDADIMCGYSRYAIVLLGAAGDDLEQPAENGALAFLQPLDERQAAVDSYITDIKSPLFGMPEYYNITWTDPNNGGPVFDVTGGSRVHYSRVIHIAHDRMGSRAFGTPGMKAIINRLYDIEKVTGGGAEAAWLAVYKGLLLTAKEGAELPAAGSQAADDLKSAVMDYINQIQRVAVLDNVDVHDLGIQTVDIRSMFDVLIEDLSGSKGVPQRKLLGSERGELASSQDMREWNSRTTSERTNQSEPVSLKPFITWCIQHKILKPPQSGKFSFAWQDVYPETLKEKADRALVMAQGAVTVTGGAPEDAFDLNEFRAVNELPPRTVEQLNEFEDEADERLRAEAEKKAKQPAEEEQSSEELKNEEKENIPL